MPPLNSSKLNAVKLILSEQRTVAEVAKELKVSVTAVRKWLALYKESGVISKKELKDPAARKTIPVNFRLPVKDCERLTRLAKLTGKTQTDVIKTALEEFENIISK